MIIRVLKRDNPYVIMDKTGLDDPRLSFRAKGILAYLLSRPDNWTPNRDQLSSVSREGVAAIRTGMKELTDAGYFERKRERRDDGTFEFVGYIYEVSKYPVVDNQPVEPVVDCPPVDCPPVDNQPVISKEEDVKNKELPPSDKPRRKMSADQLKHFTEGFADRQGFRPRGKAWLPIQQGFRAMYVEEGYTQGQIDGCMDAIAAWGKSWTINTVRRWVAAYAAGKMDNGDGAIRLSDDDGERAFSPGDIVRIAAGPHAGLIGEVGITNKRRGRTKIRLNYLGGERIVSIPTHLLAQPSETI